MPDPKDQVQPAKPGEQSQEKKPSFGEKFDKGWDEVELITTQENEAAAKAKVTTREPAAKEPPEKPDESAPEKTPFKILKVQGKDFPVYSQEEFDALASKGADYTKKTQQLAEDRRAAEKDLKEESDRLASEAKRFNDHMDELLKQKNLSKETLEKTAQAIKEAGKPEGSDEEAAIYAEFEIDPKYAQPFEVKAVREIARQRKDLAAVKELTDDIARERASNRVNTIITKERETYPYEDIVDDQGKSLTEEQLANIVTAKRRAAEAAGEKRDPERWIKEAVKELHLSQKRVKETLAPATAADADLDTIMAKDPVLAAKIKAKYGITTPESDVVKDKTTPPTLPTVRRTVPTTTPKAARPDGSKSMHDYLDDGFNDPDILKAITGG